MGLKGKKPADGAGSVSEPTVGNPEGHFGSRLWKKLRKSQPDAGPIASSVASSQTQPERFDGGAKVTVLSRQAPKDQEEMRNVQSLWDCAYEALKKNNPQLVTKYERLLSIELSKKGPSCLHSINHCH